MSKISVIIPTRKRPEHLTRCLDALVRQTHVIDEIQVGVREDDAESAGVLTQFRERLPVVAVVPEGRGVVGSMDACLRKAKGDFVALLDDDVEVPANWLERMLSHLQGNAERFGAGGRDFLQDHPAMRRSEPLVNSVGLIEWSGRITGNHHRGGGSPRAVRFLRGSNCLYRGDFLREVGFEKGLRGEGAQVHWELALGFQAMKRGGVLWYDPGVEVVHHVAPRHDADANHRGNFAANGVEDMTYNEVFVILRHAPAAMRWKCLAWNLLVGSLSCPGLVQIPRLLLKRDPNAAARIRAAWRGRMSAFRDGGA